MVAWSVLVSRVVAIPINTDAVRAEPREVERRADSAPVVVAEPPSTAELIGATVSDLSSLVRAELQLAKAEIREAADDLKRVLVLASVCAVLGVATLLLMTHAFALSLSVVLPEWAAYLSAGLLLAAFTGVVGRRLVQRARTVEPLPEQALETTKENVEWLKQRTN